MRIKKAWLGTCLGLGCLALVASSCSSTPKRAKYKPGTRSERYTTLDDIIYDNLEHQSGTGISYARTLKTNPKFDIPYTYNQYVQKWIDYYTGKGRSHFSRHLARLGRFMPYIHAVADQYDAPRDLVYLSMIESGFNVRAKSWASAVGPWQFIKSTGRMYGLNVDYYMDERRDVEKATHAAVRHLKDLYNDFGDWYLAFAAYNAGPGKVRGAIQRNGSDYWDMVRGRYLRQETKDYVPKILAAATIAKNPEKYGFRNIHYQLPVAYEKVTLDGPTDLEVAARCAGVEADLIRLLNPELLRDHTPPHIPRYELKIPKGTARQFKRQYARLSPRDRMPVLEYQVARGDTVQSIAAQYGVSTKDLVAANSGKIESKKYRRTKWAKKRVRRRGKRRYVRVKQSYYVHSYQVAEGTRLNIPSGRSLYAHSSSRDDEAAYRAGGNFKNSYAKLDLDEDLPVKQSKKKKSKQAKKEKKQKVTQVAAVSRQPQPVAEPIVYKTTRSDLDLVELGATDPGSFQASEGAFDRSDLTPSDAQLRQVVAALPGKESSNQTAPSASKQRWQVENQYYRVKSGDTLSKLAKRFGVSRQQLKAWNGKKVHPNLLKGARIQVAGEPSSPTQLAKASQQTPKAKAKPKYYRVKQGDTLSDIARAHGVSVKQLKEWNGTKVYPVLKSGSRIAVVASASTRPRVVKYKVKQGDSLYKIAKRHNTTPKKIKQMNGLDSHVIQPGAYLKVPNP